jgi:putative transcriptional regulator
VLDTVSPFDDAATLRQFDASLLTPLKSYQPGDIKRIRIKARTSQAVFARYLNTSVSTIQKWEIGEKKPSGAALKLLNIVDRKGIEVLR